jgi:hypothetical protein
LFKYKVKFVYFIYFKSIGKIDRKLYHVNVNCIFYDFKSLNKWLAISKTNSIKKKKKLYIDIYLYSSHSEFLLEIFIYKFMY